LRPPPPLRETEQVAEPADKSASDLERALAEPVFCSGAYRAFGQLGASEARALAEELKTAGSWGPMSKVAGVAQSWRELAEAIEESGRQRVGELGPEQVLIFARRLWILPPPGGLL
jgi:hypothetical protein